MEQSYDGSKLTPLFWSEISSSYMIQDIFKNHKDIAMKFINKFLGLNAGNNIEIHREKPLINKGTIDLLIQFENNGIKTDVLMEVKVHDYASATKGQIKTYYDAALEEFNESEVYFIYLTQFSKNNFCSEDPISIPETIEEFENSKKELGRNQGKIIHINWGEFHDFIKSFKETFSPEEKLIVELQENWITAKSNEDKSKKSVEVGKRELLEYFSDIKIDLEKELLFGQIVNKNKFVIDILKCTEEERGKVLDTIKKFASSESVDKKPVHNAEETLKGAKEFLTNLALLSYAKVIEICR